MLYNLRKRVKLARFNAKTSGIHRKARVTTDPASKFMLVTMLCDTDVNMYLLALASFCRYATPRSIVIVSDSLSAQHCNLLTACVPDIQIVPVEDYRVEGLPYGGTWERLACILGHNENNYVIQLDADTLTLESPKEVIDAIERNVSFTIVSRSGCEVMSFSEMSHFVADWEFTHVQVEAEKAFKDCENAEKRRYVRGCSAFAGFAKQTSSLEKLKIFSAEIEKKIGHDKWWEWGSEQVASNYLVADSPECILLPFDRYPFFKPKTSLDENDAIFYHFIGSYRFEKDKYLALSRAFIDSL